MNRKTWLWTMVPLAMVMVALAGCAGGSKVADDGSTRVEIRVTEEGFEPAEVTVPAGRPVTLVVTRKTDKTCAKEIVIATHAINQELPLDKAVEVKFTPEKPGEIRYACGMDMYAGKIVVE